MDKEIKTVNRRPLTQNQISHAVRRLRESQNAQINSILTRFKAPEPFKLPKLTPAQLYRGIASNKMRLRPLKELEGMKQHYTLFEALQLAFADPATVTKLKIYEAAQAKHLDAVAHEKKMIDIRFNKALDALMLSDADKAMQIIEDFGTGK